MGRQISHVMGHQGASWLERGSRRVEERTDLLIASLPLEADFVVADIGAGTGYFSFPVATRVPEGARSGRRHPARNAGDYCQSHCPIWDDQC